MVKMNSIKLNAIKILPALAVAALAIGLIAIADSVEARGGGGGRGGGFRGGGYRGGGGYGEPLHNFNRYGHGSWGTGRDYAYDNYQSAGDYHRSYNRPYVDPAVQRADANQTYNWGGSRLPSDMGMSRASSSVSGVRITPNRTTPISRQSLRNRANLVREYYHHRDVFRRDFWGRYSGWWYPGWRDWWAYYYYPYDELCQYWEDANCAEKPVFYDYGNEIKYSGDEVYYGSKAAATADEYFTQAQLLANSVALSSKVKPNQSDWKSLGVFSLTEGDQTNSSSLFQFATNKAGELRGNYYNTLTNEVKPLQGKIAHKTGRVAFTVGDNRDVVYDTGLANLLSNESSLLLHYGKNQTQQWNLVRIPKDKLGSESASTSNSTSKSTTAPKQKDSSGDKN